jgi:hypothetical protein
MVCAGHLVLWNTGRYDGYMIMSFRGDKIRWSILGPSAASGVCMKPTFRGPSRSSSSGIWYVNGAPVSRICTSLAVGQWTESSSYLCLSFLARWLRWHIRSLMMMTEMVLETSVSYRHQTRLIAREDFIGRWVLYIDRTGETRNAYRKRPLCI